MDVVACAAIIRRGKKLLITQRKADQTYPLKWEFPGGRVEKGESKEACIRREIKEELGVYLSSPEPYCTVKYKVGRSLLVVHYYLCRIRSGRIKRQEVEDFKWIELGKCDDSVVLGPDRKVLRMLLSSEQPSRH